MQVFKVVSQDEKDNYVSAVYHWRNPYALRYAIGKKTTPRIGKIFVFKNLKDAELFLLANPSTRFILKGTATGIGIPKQRCSYCSQFEKYWKTKKNKKKVTCDTQDLPVGTLTCSSFTPIQVV